jgi:hypothetical protein
MTKTWEGLGKTLFPTADDYMLEATGDIRGALRSLVFASAVSSISP